MADRYFGSHEFRPRQESLKTSSDRAFGLVFAGFFAILAVGGLVRHSGRWPWWLALAALLVVVSIAAPRVLGPLNRVWTRFGLLLHAIVSPVVLAILFYGCIMPIGALMRLFGNDPLRQRFDRDAASYWIRRDPPGPAGETLKNQY